MLPHVLVDSACEATGQSIIGHAKQWLFNVETSLIMLIQHAPCLNSRFQIKVGVLSASLEAVSKFR